MDIKAMIDLVVEFGVSTVNDILGVLFQPRRFHKYRLYNPEYYFNHALILWGVTAILLSIISYFVISSVTSVKEGNLFFVGSTLFIFIHGLFVALIYAGITKLFRCKESIKINLSVVLYSFSILPIIEFITVPVDQARVTAMINDQTLFSYGYVAPFRAVIGDNALITNLNIIMFLLYLYYCYLICVGIKEANKITWLRAFIISIMGFALMNIYFNVIMLPINQMFIKSVTS